MAALVVLTLLLFSPRLSAAGSPLLAALARVFLLLLLLLRAALMPTQPAKSPLPILHRPSLVFMHPTNGPTGISLRSAAGVLPMGSELRGLQAVAPGTQSPMAPGTQSQDTSSYKAPRLVS